MGRRLLYFPVTPRRRQAGGSKTPGGACRHFCGRARGAVSRREQAATAPPLPRARRPRGRQRPPPKSNFFDSEKETMSAEIEHTTTTTAVPAPEGKYVYCIIEAKEPRSFGPIGIGGRGDEVYTVHHDGLAAVVSNTPIQVYDPTRENVFAHEQVNETVMREFTVLPMALGGLFR